MDWVRTDGRQQSQHQPQVRASEAAQHPPFNRYSNFGRFGTAVNIDPEDRRDLLYTRREAEGKASIPPRAVQTFSQHPLVDSLRQLATTTENPAIRNTLSAFRVRTFEDGLFTYRVIFTVFYEALLSAKVIELCGGGVLSVRGGNKLS